MTKSYKYSALAAAALLMFSSAHAQDNSALLDILVKKKILTSQEAEAVRADLVQEQASSPANKIAIGPWVEELKVGGDIRLRYQYDNKDYQADPAGVGSDEDRSPSGTQRSRWRFRLRLNADFKLANNWFGGVQLQTNNAADSALQTYGDGFSNYNIYISKAFIGWNANEWLTLVAGKQANPFYTTELVWDADINPTGLVEIVKFHKLFGKNAQEDVNYSKDGKAIITKAKDSGLPWELTLNLAQFIYDDNPEGDFDNDASTDAYIFAGQLVGSYKFSNDVKVTFAPAMYFYNAADLSGFVNENSFHDVDGISGETRKMTIVTAPGEVSFKLAGIPTKFYWDFAYNLQGQGRVDDIYGLVKQDHAPDETGTGFNESYHKPEDDYAYMVGVQLGQNKKAGDWSINANWRQTGIAAVDPNLNESDFALSELNTRGVKSTLTYSFTEFANVGVSYMYAWNLRNNLTGGQATGGADIAEVNAVQVFQVDLNVKF